MTVSRSSMLPSRTLTDCSVIRGDQSDGVEAVESVPAEVSDLEGRVNPLFFGRIQAAAHADGELSVSSSLRQRGRNSFSFESSAEQIGGRETHWIALTLRPFRYGAFGLTSEGMHLWRESRSQRTSERSVKGDSLPSALETAPTICLPPVRPITLDPAELASCAAAFARSFGHRRGFASWRCSARASAGHVG